MSAVVHSEEQLSRTAGEKAQRGSPVPHVLGKSLSPSQDSGLGSLSRKPANISAILPMPWSKEGASDLGEKKNRKNPEAGKQNTGTKKPGTVVKIDFCLLETVSRKCHSSFMLIHSGFCLPPPANLAPPQRYAVGFQCNVSGKSNCFKKHFLAHEVLQSCHALWQSKCLNKYAKVCSSQTAFQGTKRVFSPFSADPSSSQFVFVNTSHALEHTYQYRRVQHPNTLAVCQYNRINTRDTNARY